MQCAANGRDALRLLNGAEVQPALILSDLMMPDLDGWGLLAELHHRPQLADIPVVIISALSDFIAQEAEEAGAAAVLRKPVDPATLLRVIEHCARIASSKIQGHHQPAEK